MTASKRTISYRELRDETALFAGVLAANGIGKEKRARSDLPKTYRRRKIGFVYYSAPKTWRRFPLEFPLEL